MNATIVYLIFIILQAVCVWIRLFISTSRYAPDIPALSRWRIAFSVVLLIWKCLPIPIIPFLITNLDLLAKENDKKNK